MLKRSRTYVYLSLLIFCGLIFYDLGTQLYWWQTGRTLAREAAPVAYQQPLSGKHERVLFLGDSTVVGTGALVPDDSLVGRFGRDCKNLEIINLGKNGDRLPGLDQRFNLVTNQKFDLVIIQIGGNDVVHNTPAPLIESSLISVVRKARVVARRVVLVPSGLDLGQVPFFPWFFDQTLNERSANLDEIFSRVAAVEGVAMIKLTEGLVGADFFEQPINFADDRFHPSSAGYAIWYSQLRGELVRQGIILIEQGTLGSRCFIN
jgi:lysophospholipase L1-like esterase